MSILNNKIVDLRIFDSWEVHVEMYEEIFDEIIENLKKVRLMEIRAENIVYSFLN